ncbi:nucleoside recognition domain-containing protein [Clostridiaceae bacterium M8S5]|nr:nucleoside recognition domain-containing protein [Clostridiaceae bacterium M8S5]
MKDSTAKSQGYKTLKRGLEKGLKTTWMLAKIVIPIQFLVVFLKYIHLLDKISVVFEPFMNVFGLPGEASLVLVFGNVINIYAAIGAITSLSLTAKQATIIAVMLSFSHSLPVESAVAKKTGISAGLVIIIRLILAILAGIILKYLI